MGGKLNQMMHPEDTASPVKLQNAFKMAEFGKRRDIQVGFSHFQKLEHTDQHQEVQGGFFDPTDVELNDWMKKSKDLGEEMTKQNKKRAQTSGDDYVEMSGRGVLSGRGALQRMEPKFLKKNTTDSGSLATALIAFRNYGNERFLAGDYSNSIQAYTEAWSKYESEKKPRSEQVDDVIGQILLSRALAYRKVGEKALAHRDN